MKSKLLILLLLCACTTQAQTDTSRYGWETSVVVGNWPKENNDVFWWPDYSEKQITWRPVLKKPDSGRYDIIRIFGEPVTKLTIDTIKQLRAEAVRRKLFIDSVMTAKRVADSIAKIPKPVIIYSTHPQMYKPKGGAYYDEGDYRIEIVKGKKVKKKKPKPPPKAKAKTQTTKAKPEPQYYYIIQTNQKLDMGVEYHNGLIIVHKKFKNRAAALSTK